MKSRWPRWSLAGDHRESSRSVIAIREGHDHQAGSTGVRPRCSTARGKFWPPGSEGLWRFRAGCTVPWSNIGTAHRLIILDICAKLFINPTRGSKDIERTRKCDGQTDRRLESSHRWTFVGYFSTQQVSIGLPEHTDGRTDGRTDGQTDSGAKNNMSPHFMGGDIIQHRV